VVVLATCLAGPAPLAASPEPAAAGRGPRPVVPTSQFRWPLPGHPTVVRPFSPSPTRYGRGHRGVDLAAAPGVTVLAAGAGRVAFAGVVAGRGVVSVDHAGGLRTTYEPVTGAVAAGDVVTAGTVLGTLASGHAGCRAPACLHWGLRRGRTYLDPLALLGRGPVRLLPLRRRDVATATSAIHHAGHITRVR